MASRDRPFMASTSLDMARSPPLLRGYTERTQRLYDRSASMTHPQMVWGDPLDIFAEPGASELPLILRQGAAVRQLLPEMPITIEADDLVVGNSPQDGVIVRTRLPRYGTAEEYHLAKGEGTGF